MGLIHGIPFTQCIFLTLYALTFLSLFCSKTTTIIRPINFKSLFSLLFCLTIIVGPLIRTTAYADYANLQTEIYSDKKLLFPYLVSLLQFFINHLSSYDFLLIVSLASGIILLFSIYIFSIHFTLSKVNLSLLLFSIIPLQAFHFTQYISFCLFSLSIVLALCVIKNSGNIAKNKSYIFPSLIFFLVGSMAHPVYIISYLVILIALIAQSKVIHLIARYLPKIYLSHKLRSSKLQIELGFIFLFLLLAFFTSRFAGIIYTYILSQVPSYSIYSNWIAQESYSLIPELFKLLLLYMPFIIYSVFLIKPKASRFSFALNFYNNIPLLDFHRSIIITSLLFSVAVLITSLSFNFYSLQRLQSALYPLLIFSPLISICRFRETSRLFNPRIIDNIYLLICFLVSMNRILSYPYSV